MRCVVASTLSTVSVVIPSPPDGIRPGWGIMRDGCVRSRLYTGSDGAADVAIPQVRNFKPRICRTEPQSEVHRRCSGFDRTLSLACRAISSDKKLDVYNIARVSHESCQLVSISGSPPARSSLPLNGGCQCGACRYVIGGWPLTFYICHCSECQAQSASAFGESLRSTPGT